LVVVSLQDKDGNDGEEKLKEETEPQTTWTGYNGTSAVTGHLAGLLAQNGQNNGGSSSVSLPISN